jgi:uncharacterized protein with von Willebrand factor type A (vWA) domain
VNALTVAADEMAETDWVRVGLEAGASLASGLVGLVVGAWNWGRRSAVAEQALKDDVHRKVDELREQTRASMEKHEDHSNSRTELLVEQFKESFDGIRRQIDDHKLATEREFVRKDELRVLRDEIREDMREIKAMIAAMSRQ